MIPLKKTKPETRDTSISPAQVFKSDQRQDQRASGHPAETNASFSPKAEIGLAGETCPVWPFGSQFTGRRGSVDLSIEFPVPFRPNFGLLVKLSRTDTVICGAAGLWGRSFVFGISHHCADYCLFSLNSPRIAFCANSTVNLLRSRAKWNAPNPCVDFGIDCRYPANVI